VSKAPSYYEIALTQRQVVIAFVILLTCLVAAFFSGVWVGSGGRGPRPAAQVAETATPGGLASGTLEGGSGAAPGGEPGIKTEPGPGSLRFFSEAGSESAGKADTPPHRVYDDPDDPRRRSDVTTPVHPLPQAPEPVDPRATEPPGDGGPVIQVFSSHDQAQAQQVLDRLLQADLDAYLSPAEVNGVIHYRVRLGPFHDRDQAEAVAAQLRQDFKLETWITR